MFGCISRWINRETNIYYKILLCNSLSITLIFVILSSGCSIGNQDIARHSDSQENTEQPTTELNATTQNEMLACLKRNCWVNIIPGSTTLTQAQTLLETHYGQGNIMLNQHMISWKSETSVDKSQGGFLTGTEQGIVDQLTVTFLRDQLTVGEIITQLGEPSLVYVNRAFSSEFPCAGSLISYPQIGVNAQLYPEGTSIGVQAGQSVQSLTLLPLDQAKKWTITDSVASKWQGYKEYCDIIAK